MRLATRFALTMSLVITILVVSISFHLIRSEKRKLTDEMERQAETLTESITLGINSATFLERRSLLIDYFDQLVPQSGGQVLYALIAGLDNYVWLHTLREGEYEILRDPVSEEVRSRLETEPRVVKQFEHPSLKEEVLEIATLVVANGMERGILRIGFSMKPLRERIRLAIRNSVIIGALSLLAGILVSLSLARLVSRPIARMVGYAREIAEGRLAAPIPRVSKTKEIVELSASIEQMKRDLKYIYIGGFFTDLSHAIKSDLGFLYSELERFRGGQAADAQAYAEMVARLDRVTREIQKYKELQKPTNLKKVETSSGAFLKGFVDQWPANERQNLKTCIPEDLPPIRCDPTYVARALSHIVRNALEAVSTVPDPFVSLTASRENGQLVIRVSDKGVGIPAKEMERVFEPGYTTKKERGGEGLGLAFTKMIIEDLHGGTVQVVSREGEGTTVFLGFPA